MIRSKALAVTTGVPEAGVVPNLRAYDVILVSTSAGKDSQAMLDYVCGLARESGVLDRVVAVHVDLGDRVEWEGTKALAAAQAARYGVRFEVVSRIGTVSDGQAKGDVPLYEAGEARGDLLDHVLHRHR